MRCAYICDRRRGACGKRAKCGLCIRTTRPEHALFGAVDDPGMYPERFALLDDGMFYELDCAKMWIWLKIIYNCLTQMGARHEEP